MELKIVTESDKKRIFVSGELLAHTCKEFHVKLSKALGKHDVVVNLSEVSDIDTSAIGVFTSALIEASNKGRKLHIEAPPDHVRSTLSLASTELVKALEPPRRMGFFELVGDSTVTAKNNFIELLQVLADTFYFGLVGLFRGRGFRFNAVIKESVRLGADALPIVVLISFLIGITVALQAAHQLRQFGANIYVANLVGVAMTRELGPLMTAIIVAGRSGSAIAAEIGTMKVTEEIDALKVMGLHPIQYLVVPKFYAVSMTQVMLTVFSDMVSVFGGFIIGVTMLDLGVSIYIEQTLQAVLIQDFIVGLVKALAFGWVIVLVGVHYGFMVSGGAAGVGRAATQSVVVGIFGVILTNTLFSTVFYFFG